MIADPFDDADVVAGPGMGHLADPSPGGVHPFQGRHDGPRRENVDDQSSVADLFDHIRQDPGHMGVKGHSGRPCRGHFPFEHLVFSWAYSLLLPVRTTPAPAAAATPAFFKNSRLVFSHDLLPPVCDNDASRLCSPLPHRTGKEIPAAIVERFADLCLLCGVLSQRSTKTDFCCYARSVLQSLTAPGAS